jgi:hypothetical protein
MEQVIRSVEAVQSGNYLSVPFLDKDVGSLKMAIMFFLWKRSLWVTMGHGKLMLGGKR